MNGQLSGRFKLMVVTSPEGVCSPVPESAVPAGRVLLLPVDGGLSVRAA